MKLRWILFKFRLKDLWFKIRHPRTGYYTRMVLSSGHSLEEIDLWVEDNSDDLEFQGYKTIHEKREAVCEDEVGCWEE